MKTNKDSNLKKKKARTSAPTHKELVQQITESNWKFWARRRQKNNVTKLKYEFAPKPLSEAELNEIKKENEKAAQLKNALPSMKVSEISAHGSAITSRKYLAKAFWICALLFLAVGIHQFCHLISIADDSFWGRAFCVVCFVCFSVAGLLAGAVSKNDPLPDTLALGLIVVVIGFGAFLLVISGPLKVTTSPNTNRANSSPPAGQISADDSSSSVDLKFDAYYTAKQFIQGQYPGAKSFSDYDHSHVDNKGNGIWWVTVNVDGVNTFNAPTRNTMLVEMKSENAHWYLVEIDNQPE